MIRLQSCLIGFFKLNDIWKGNLNSEKSLTHLRSSERRWIGLVASLNKAFSQYYSMAKDTWIQVGEFVSCRSGWRSWVVGVGCCFFFWSNSYGGWPRCFFCLNLVQSNEGLLIWNQHHFKIVEELPKWCICYIRESTNFLFNGDGFGRRFYVQDVFARLSYGWDWYSRDLDYPVVSVTYGL